MAKTIVGNQWQKEIVKRVNHLSGKHSVRHVWDDFVIGSALEISNAVDLLNKDERMKMAKTLFGKYTEEDVKIFGEMFGIMVNALEANPEQDFLGSMYMCLDFGSDAAGQVFTPYSVCKMMAEMNFVESIASEIEEKGFVRINDCACGGGATLIAAANALREMGISYQDRALFVAQDLDIICVSMCYVQMSLLGMPGYVYHGDTLANPCVCADHKGLFPKDTANTWYTPIYFSPTWTGRKQAAKMDMILQGLRREPVTPRKESRFKKVER